jgi:hypothetical protein
MPLTRPQLQRALMQRQVPLRPVQQFPHLLGAFFGVIILMIGGCVAKPAYLQGEKTDISNRWKVEKIEPTRLSEDQRETLQRQGPPAFVRFFREVETRKPVYAWIYATEAEIVDLVWFVDGKRVDEIAVDSDPSAYSSTTRRRARTAVLVATGAAVLPAIVILANQ